MQTESVVEILDNPAKARDWLRSVGVDNVEQAHRNLVAMADSRITLDLLAIILQQLSDHLPNVSHPDAVLNNLERFVSASRSPLALGSLFDRDREALPTLLQILSASQYLSDLLIRDPEGYDLLRLTEGQPVSREVLIEELCTEVNLLNDDRSVMATLRRFKHRETLRVAYGDIIRKQSIETVTRQISFLADAVCEAALRHAIKQCKAKRGVPRLASGERARFVILALGKLGGNELNYSSDIDLIALYEGEGKSDANHGVTNNEYFERLVRQVSKLLTESTDLGTAYRVDLRLRPEGSQGPLAINTDAALRYYDVKGRTWERQAFVKARSMAGDIALGNEFLAQLEPWIYRRYLTRADITGIKALKRRIEQRSKREGVDSRDVKAGAGGIRDIEFVIQFLQLLNGGDLPEVRNANTLEALGGLEQVGCLTMQERSILEQNYSFLRNVEHRLQIMFDLQTHSLPDSDTEMRRLAIRMGYADTETSSALDQFTADLGAKTELNRKILDHLLHDAFADDDDCDPETDLILDPSPPESTIREVLARYEFSDVIEAHKILSDLAAEKISFLSTRRCRHFLAAIAPRLLKAIAATPDPDATLINLSKVSDSLGGKGVLWELFSFNPPSLQLYVRLCASSSYLSSLLTSNPGMIDELMDSLVLDRLPTRESLTATLDDLCRGAIDVDPILHSFKHSQHLRVGVRDILNRDDIQATHRALSDIAEVCLAEITRREYSQLAAKFGEPTVGDGQHAGSPCSLVILALGKLGGREPNYHSDLDVVFLYEAEGMTKATHPSRRDKTTTNQHFFGQLAQRIIKVVTQIGPQGRLYELDPRLRPTGKSGSLAVSIEEFSRYFESGKAQLWERQSLCKARAMFGSERAVETTMQVVRHWILNPAWTIENVEQIRVMRHKLQESASPRNLKRGPGGTVDVEFIVQMLQLRYAAECQDVLQTGTLESITALRSRGHLSDELASYLSKSYRFLRSVESGLRLMNTTARHDLPRDEHELDKLAYLLGYEGAQALLDDCREYTRENRKRFQRVFGDALS